MIPRSLRALKGGLDPEKVAYWYLRLNGFLQIENFVIHPGRCVGQRTDADLLAVRFPYRAEFLVNHPENPMPDDVAVLSLSGEMIDVVLADTNGPWTREDRQSR
jgi:hypothetical protein